MKAIGTRTWDAGWDDDTCSCNFHRGNGTREDAGKGNSKGHVQPKGLELSLVKDTHVDHVYVFGKRYDQPSRITLVSRLC